MILPLQITFRNMKPSEAAEAYVRERAQKLDKFYGQIVACRVVIEAPHKHHHKGNLYRTRIDITVPEGELVFAREPSADHTHEDVYVAIRDAFDAIRRQLEDYSMCRRGDVKTHQVPCHGRISQLFPDAGYGCIETLDGREIYFHQNSVVNERFDKLNIGAEVRFAEEAGERGPQASTVLVVGKHHIVE